jgi:hypothetical protein
MYRCPTCTESVRILGSKWNFGTGNTLCTGIASKEHKPIVIYNGGAAVLYDIKTNWRTIRLGKLIVTQLIKKNTKFDKIQNVIADFTRARS